MKLIDKWDEIFASFGYDADDPVRGLDIPERLLEDLAAADDADGEGEAA